MIDSEHFDDTRIGRLAWVGLCTAVAVVPICLGISLIDLAFPLLLAIGALTIRSWPQIGRGLMWAGVVTIGISVFPFCIMLLLHPNLPAGRSDFNGMAMMLGAILGTILVPACILLLFFDLVSTVRKKRKPHPGESR
jgi:hypothetical protein